MYSLEINTLLNKAEDTIYTTKYYKSINIGNNMDYKYSKKNE